MEILKQGERSKYMTLTGDHLVIEKSTEVIYSPDLAFGEKKKKRQIVIHCQQVKCG